jgi:hypothetical protein
LLGTAGVLLLVMLAYLRLHTLVVASWAMMIAACFGVSRHRIPRIGGALAIGVLIPLVFGGIGLAGMGLVTNAGSLEERRFLNAQDANTAVVDPNEPVRDENAGELGDLDNRVADLEARLADATGSEAKRLQGELNVLRSQRAALLAANGSVSLGDEPLDPDLAHLPRGLSVMLLEPFPVPFEGSLSLRLARLESLLWYPLLLLAAVGLWRARRHLPSLVFPALAAGGILVMYALTEGNIGTAHRHRGEFVWVIAMLAALGLSRVRQRALTKEAAQAADVYGAVR